MNEEGLGIQYIGVPGVTHDCVEAIAHLIQSRVKITSARILTCKNRHCLFLTTEFGEMLVKSGFTSGYSGTGPAGFSEVLALLDGFDTSIDEIEVANAVLVAIDQCGLNAKTLEWIRAAKPVVPSRLYDYVRARDYGTDNKGPLWRKVFQPLIPFAIIDPRIIDLAMTFWDNPDNSLNVGYRRLEDIFRKRLRSQLIGRALFGVAFLNKPIRFTWKGCSDSEHSGRAELFTGITQAHRNPRMHQELKHSEEEMLSEFLLLNHLFRLEAEVIRNRSTKKT